MVAGGCRRSSNLVAGGEVGGPRLLPRLEIRDLRRASPKARTSAFPKGADNYRLTTNPRNVLLFVWHENTLSSHLSTRPVRKPVSRRQIPSMRPDLPANPPLSGDSPNFASPGRNTRPDDFSSSAPNALPSSGSLRIEPDLRFAPRNSEPRHFLSSPCLCAFVSSCVPNLSLAWYRVCTANQIFFQHPNLTEQ